MLKNSNGTCYFVECERDLQILHTTLGIFKTFSSFQFTFPCLESEAKNSQHPQKYHPEQPKSEQTKDESWHCQPNIPKRHIQKMKTRKTKRTCIKVENSSGQ